MSKYAVTNMLLSMFYSLVKDNGVQIVYTKPGKGDIDSDTGVRDTSQDKNFTINAVETPVDNQQSFITKLLGKVEKPATLFLIRVCDLPGIVVETGDYFTANGIKYKVTDSTVSAGTLIELSGTAFK